MIRLTSNIYIHKYIFEGVVSCEVESGWEMLTSVSRIQLPRRISWSGRNIVLDSALFEDPLLRKGMGVAVDLGYDNKNKRVFLGYVTRISSNNPFELHCEDAMWLLKQKTITKSWKDVTLSKLLEEIVGGIMPIKCVDIQLGGFRINKSTIVEVLEELRKMYFLKSFIRDNTLYVGLAYWPHLQKEHEISFIRHVVSNDLEYIRKEDVKIKLKVIVVKKNNKKVEYEYGDKDGEERTLHFYNIDKSTVDKTAGVEIERLRYEGYRGSVTIFGAPQIQHGDVLNIYDEYYPEREGRYLVKKVTTTFGMSGFRQQLELDSKV